MIDFASREVTATVRYKEQGQEAWFEIRYLSQKKMESFKNDIEMFKYIILDWGDDFKSPSGKDWDCTDKNKQEFYWEVPDLTAKLLMDSFNKFTFNSDTTAVISRLGKSQNTNGSGAKRKQLHTTRTAEPA